MVKTLYLIRHGETEGADSRRYKGSIDVPMSEKGAAQIRKAAEFIGSRVKGQVDLDNSSKLTAVYCSPLSRALKSAEIIAEDCGLKPVVVDDLRERHFGIWEGMSFDEIRGAYPDEFKAWADNPLKYSPVGGESTLKVRDRVVAALNRILDDNSTVRVQGFRDSSEETDKSLESPAPRTPDSVHIAIVAHGGVNRIILCHVTGIPLENIFRVEQDFGCINIIEFWDEYPVVKLINGGVLG